MKIFYPHLLIVTLILFFSSCSVNDNWTSGTLDFRMSAVTDQTGYFLDSKTIYPENITVNGYVSDFQFRSAQIVVSGVGANDILPGDELVDVRVYVDNITPLQLGDISVYTNNNGEVVAYISGNDLNSYLFHAIENMRQFGNSRISVDGYLYHGNTRIPGARLFIDFYNDLDVNVQ
ncbi:MAG: hypothetical protein QM654_00465 [Dysgonamonadaceae bacterium]